MQELYNKLPIETNDFQLLVLGDLHIGDVLCDLDLIKNTINYAKQTKNCFVILNGDLMNNGLKTSKTDSYMETMSMSDQQDLLIDLLYPIKNKILVMTTGNHEYRTNLIAGINPLKAVATALGIKDKLVDNSYLLQLDFGIANGDKKYVNKYVIFGIHGGSGGGRRAGSTANALEDMTKIRPDMDLYIHSHTHTPMQLHEMTFLYNKTTKKSVEHLRTLYNANAFLKYGGYAEQKGFKPVDRTPGVLYVKANRTKNGMKITTDLVRI